MNTKNNQRTRLSKILLKNALMDLLSEKGSVTKISVRELCERADLNRSTFYAHYSEPKELLEEVEAELLDATRECLQRSVELCYSASGQLDTDAHGSAERNL